MKHTPARGKAHRPVLGESARAGHWSLQEGPGDTLCRTCFSLWASSSKEKRDFLGGPVDLDSVLPLQGRGFHLELRSRCPLAWPKKKGKEEFLRHLPPTQTPLFHCPCHFPFYSFLSPQMFPHPPHTLPPSPFLKNTSQIPFPPHPGFPGDPVNIAAVYLASTQLLFSWCVTVLARMHAL